VAAGFLLANAEATVANKFPNTQFAITDYPVEAAPFSDKKGKLLVKNITGITFKSEQQSYLVGCLSALMAKRGGGNTISATGGVKIPPVDAFIAGYKAGAAKCVPGTKVLVGYSQDFIAQDKCKAVAENQIQAGSKVVFAVAGPCGFGALAAAKEAGVWGDGVDVDQSYLGPHILTSAVKRVDLGVFRFVQAVKDGTLVPGHDFVFDLKNGGVAVGKISPKVPAAYKARIKALQEQIIAGKIKVPTSI
jgi:basic membrane protein A and related proteins